MEQNLPSISSSLSANEPVSSRTLHLHNFLREKAVDLQTRENRQSREFISDLLAELEQVKFECLNLKGEICDLFVTISKKAEICERQLQVARDEQSSPHEPRRRKRRDQQFRESFGFSEFKDADADGEDLSFEASEDDEPEYIKHFQMAKRRNEDAIWGGASGQMEGDALDMRPEFRDVKYTVLAPAEEFRDRIQIVKE